MLGKYQSDDVLIALHYQNENCHPDGKIKVGISEGAEWRERTLDTARRLLRETRAAGVPIIHVRLAVRPDHADVIQNNFIFRQWVELGAWAEGSWGVEFLEGFEPLEHEQVVYFAAYIVTDLDDAAQHLDGALFPGRGDGGKWAA